MNRSRVAYEAHMPLFGTDDVRLVRLYADGHTEYMNDYGMWTRGSDENRIVAAFIAQARDQAETIARLERRQRFARRDR